LQQVVTPVTFIDESSETGKNSKVLINAYRTSDFLGRNQMFFTQFPVG
jgi:hypothetical protein